MIVLVSYVLHSVKDEATKEDGKMKKSLQQMHTDDVMKNEGDETAVDDGNQVIMKDKARVLTMDGLSCKWYLQYNVIVIM